MLFSTYFDMSAVDYIWYQQCSTFGFCWLWTFKHWHKVCGQILLLL